MISATISCPAASQASDLLVIGTGRRGSLRQLLGCSVFRYCMGNAKCSVRAIPPPHWPRRPVTAFTAGHSATASEILGKSACSEVPASLASGSPPRWHPQE
jgi:hypothetical protein